MKDKEGSDMKDDLLGRRRAELAAFADQRDIDWRARLEGLPAEDDVLQVLALATLLRLDFERVFDADTNLAELSRESHRLEVEKELLDDQLRREMYARAVHWAEPQEFRYGAH
jgi:hypothetical protein